MFEGVLVSSVSFFLSVGALWLLRRASLSSRVLFSQNVAIVGGIGIAAAFFLLALGGVFFKVHFSPPVLLIMAASLLMLVLGVMDDLKEHSVAEKVLAQFVCTSILVAGGMRTGLDGLGAWGNVFLTYIWIMGMTNAFNLLDVMDGVAAGSAFLCVIGLLALSAGADPALFVLLLGIGGAVAGFLVFNMPPATIYLGNAGSHFLGFFLASSAVMALALPATQAWGVVGLAFIFGLPLLEMLSLIVRRMRKGMWPFQKSEDHLALRLMARMRSKPVALAVMLGMGLLFVLMGVGLGHVGACLP